MESLQLRKIRQGAFVVIPIITTVTLWLLAYLDNNIPLEFTQTFRYIGQLLGLVGVVLLAMNYLIATRLYLIELLYGGLDKVYKLHAKLGKIAFLLIILHPIALALNQIENSQWVIAMFVPFTEISSTAMNAGVIGLYLFIILIILSIFRFMPYHIWKWTHMLLGVPFLLISFHALQARGISREYAALEAWVIMWILIGIMSYVYKTFLYKWLGPKAQYVISSVKNIGAGITEIYFSPKSKKLSYEPGEFVFVSFKSNPRIPSEHHPYTISSSPAKEDLRISFKVFGDYTEKLVSAQIGDEVDLFGPYGEFTSNVFSSYKKQIWIAGGIGITPFMSMMDYESTNEDSKDIIFYYSVNKIEEAVYDLELERMMTGADDNIRYKLHVASEKGYLSALDIQKRIGEKDLSEWLILMCGPLPMVKSLEKQFLELGVKKSRIVYEEFGFG